MSWFDLRIAALVLGLTGPTGPTELPATARVIATELDVFDEPDDHSMATGRLARGARVVVRAVGADGWLTIEPPPGSFLWVEQGAIDPPAGRGAGIVDRTKAQVRSGLPSARMPGPPRAPLARGQTIQLLGRPPLTFGGKTWRAIAPTAGEVRHIRAEGVEWLATASPEPAKEARASFMTDSDGLPEPPPTVASEINRIEASHRTVLRASIEHWQLEPILKRYQTLLKQTRDPASTQAIQARIDLVQRQQAAADSARSIEEILSRSRSRDRKLALDLRRFAQAEEPQQRPYDAQGMIQPSSRKVDGQKVFALIGPKGTAIAYLNIPAGLDPSPLATRNVGVRGSARYDESLRARLITVHDIEPLDERRE